MTVRSAEIAVIGGGAIGTSTLFHLTERHGLTDAVLFEKDQIGAGSTSKAAGGVRNTFTSRLNVELGNENIRFFENFEEAVGEPLEFRQNGYMYLFHDEEHERTWRERAEFFGDNGVDASVLSPEAAADEFEELDPSAIGGALYAPDCGHVDPHRLTQAFGKTAVNRGATIETKTAVQDVTPGRNGELTVEADGVTYEVGAVLNAAGPWAGRLSEMVGVGVPIELLVRRIMVTSQLPGASGPLVIDPELGCYFSAEPNGSLLLCDTDQDRHDVDDPDTAVAGDVGYDYYLSVLEKIQPLLPVLDDLEVINGWGGIQTHTPDGHAVLGPTSVENFYLACGFSGHGVQQSPMVGAAMADLLVEGETDVLDVGQLGLDRFESSVPITPEGMA